MRGLPCGFRSIGGIPAERIERARQSFFRVFTSHGYSVLLPSAVQLFGSCWERLSDEIRNRMISLGTPSGETGCLSPDITLASVSFLSAHYAPEERPLRICYGERVFRSPSAPDNTADTFQLGAELLGWDGEGADVELLTLLLRALDVLGVEESFVVIGDVTILSSLLAGLPEQTASALRNALSRQSFPAFREIMERAPLPESLRSPLNELPSLRGGMEVLKKASRILPRGCSTEGVGKLAGALCSSGFEERVLIDLSLARELDYYSGPVFEVFCGKHGKPLGGGGRYDGLLSSFGMMGQAIGFSLNLDLILEPSGISPARSSTVMAWPGKLQPDKALSIAECITEFNRTIEMSWVKQRHRSIELARRRNYRWWTDLSEDHVYDLTDGSRREREEWLKEGWSG